MSTDAGTTATVSLVGITTTVPNVEPVVLAAMARLRLCYRTGLAHDPAMMGRLGLLLKVRPNGAVASATLTSNTGLSPDVAKCVAAAAGAWRFERPAAGSDPTVTFALFFMLR
jgi:hypothetical protein